VPCEEEAVIKRRDVSTGRVRLGTDSVTAEREGTEIRKKQIKVDEGSDRVASDDLG
jgi:hypothetical protein